MSEKQPIEERFSRPFYSMARALQMKEVPMLVMREEDQSAFIQQVTSLIGGTVLYSTASDVGEQVLENIAEPRDLFLLIEEPLAQDLSLIVSYYLENRDILQEAQGLQERFKGYPIHPDHRLILVVEASILESQPNGLRQYLRELSTVIFVS